MLEEKYIGQYSAKGIKSDSKIKPAKVLGGGGVLLDLSTLKMIVDFLTNLRTIDRVYIDSLEDMNEVQFTGVYIDNKCYETNK